MEFGSWPETYYVPWHLLRSTTWEEVPAGEHISLPFLSKAVGHTIVHYLYTGEYQTLSEIESITQTPQSQFEHAFLVYMASLDHDLSGLEELAMLKMEKYSLSMDLKTVVDVTRNNLDKEMKPSPWLQAFLKERLQNDFQKDHTVFADEAFYSGLCQESILNGHVMRYMVELLTERLTQTLAEKKNIAVAEGLTPPDDPCVVEEPASADDDLYAVGGTTSIKEPAAVEEPEIPPPEDPEPPPPEDPEPPPPEEPEPPPPEEPETPYEASLPPFGFKTYGFVSAYTAPPKPCYSDRAEEISLLDTGAIVPGIEPVESIEPDCCIPELPLKKKETMKQKKMRRLKEKREKARLEEEQQARMEQEEMEAFCEEAVPGGNPAPVESDSSWELAEPRC